MGTRPRGGDEGGADVIALGQGGQALNMDAEESAEGVGLCLAELGELSGDVLDGAVPLAQLQADDDVVTDGAGAGSVALDAQGLHQGLGTGLRFVAGGVETALAPLLEGTDALVGKGSHGLLSAGLADEAHGVDGELVIVRGQTVVTEISHDPLSGRAPTPTLARVRSTTRDGAGLRELIEVTTHAGRGQPELGGQGGSRDGTQLADDVQDAVARAGITCRVVGLRRRLHGSR